MTSVDERNAAVINEFRENGGRVGGPFEGMPLLILHMTGAKSGEPRLKPMAFLRDGERYVVFASYAGRPNNPAWYHNLIAQPNVAVEAPGPDGTVETFAARAIEVVGAERDALYARQAAIFPGFAEYQERTVRPIPVSAVLRGCGRRRRRPMAAR